MLAMLGLWAFLKRSPSVAGLRTPVATLSH
jgi:hypothetical protein